jgi:hypothetical protein
MNTPLQLKTLKIKKQFDICFSILEKQMNEWDLKTPIYYDCRVQTTDEIFLRALDNVITKLKLNSWDVDVIVENLREDFYELKLKITPKHSINSEDPYVNFKLGVATTTATC